jgi:hypothetical protein
MKTHSMKTLILAALLMFPLVATEHDRDALTKVCDASPELLVCVWAGKA